MQNSPNVAKNKEYPEDEISTNKNAISLKIIKEIHTTFDDTCLYKINAESPEHDCYSGI